MQYTPKWIICHHSGGSDANPLQDSSNYTVAQCDEDHKNRDFPKSSLGYYVGYQYVITKDGKVTQCRLDTEEGAHCNQSLGGVSFNRQSIGVMLCGNFDLTLPTKAQETALKALLEQKVKQWGIPVANIVPHRRFAVKTCFGRRLLDDWAQKLLSPAVLIDKVTPLLQQLNLQVGSKDYKGAKDTTSYLFNELTKLL